MCSRWQQLVLFSLLLLLCVVRAFPHDHDPDFDSEFADEEDEDEGRDEEDDDSYSAVATTPEPEEEWEDEEDFDALPGGQPDDTDEGTSSKKRPQHDGGETQTNKPKKAKATATKQSVPGATGSGNRAQQFQFDEDEFEGFDGDQPYTNHFQTSQPEPEVPAEPFSWSNLLGWVFPTRKLMNVIKANQAPHVPQEHYYYEFVALGFLSVYALNFIMGRRKNENIARTWLRHYRTLFAEQFSRIGVGQEKTDETGCGGPPLLKDSMSLFKFWASGRINCEYCMVTMDLRKRHDLFSLLLETFSPTDDLLTIEIGMNEESMDPLLFAVMRAGQYEKKMRRDKPDLVKFGTDYQPERGGLNDMFSIISDSPELVQKTYGLNSPACTVLPEEFKKFIHDNKDLFISMHISDVLLTEDMAFQQTILQNQQANSSAVPATAQPLGRKAIQFQFKLPSSSQMDSLAPLMRMALQSIELVARAKLSPNQRAKNAQKRQDYLDTEERKLQQQRDEQQTKGSPKKKPEVVDYASLTREQQRKRDEKERKQMLKKKMPKVKIVH